MELAVPETDQVDELVELWVRLADGQRDHGSHLSAEENRQQIRESMLRHIVANRVLVADTGQIDGFVMFTTETTDYVQDCTRGLIENLYVRPEARGEGIGSALLQAAERQLSDAGVDTVTLEVMAPNEDARRFYRRHGYRPHRLELEKSLSDDP
jgi:ribosomal protein S18 acetylase RimI-like enzyme